MIFFLRIVRYKLYKSLDIKVIKSNSEGKKDWYVLRKKSQLRDINSQFWELIWVYKLTVYRAIASLYLSSEKKSELREKIKLWDEKSQ